MADLDIDEEIEDQEGGAAAGVILQGEKKSGSGSGGKGLGATMSGKVNSGGTNIVDLNEEEEDD